MPIAVTIPLLNPNEPEAMIAALQVKEGKKVTKGDVLCTLETTKSAADLEAEQDGYIIDLRFSQGQTVAAGGLLCYLSEDPDWAPPDKQGVDLSVPSGAELPSQQNHKSIPTNAVPEGLRITQPALALARQMGLALDRLPHDRLVTESVVRSFLVENAEKPRVVAPDAGFDSTAILVYGGGGHGKSLIDLLRSLGSYRLVGVIDDGIPVGRAILGLQVLGGSEALPDLYAQGVRLAVNAVGGIGNLTVRVEVFQKLAQAGFACPAVIHPTAFVEASAALSPGVQVFPHAYVGSEAHIGYGCIINTGAIVSHDCVLADYANISPGAMLAGEVQVGAGVLVGMGATLNLRVKIGAGARIGNGATVKQDVPEKALVRAGAIWPE